ncbi:arylsulfotransferase family protein [Lolliginicoccus suaedae]|uniref:arylsulfotransferase family protein n=1 Tax=Lolliginicoccus suaedae TaxID=2605429 RepID=UPI0016593493|nr:arylsulfotransferase family protein [Lolliginicoccus suaedae]
MRYRVARVVAACASMTLLAGCFKADEAPVFPATLDVGARTYITAPQLRPPVVAPMLRMDSATPGSLLLPIEPDRSRIDDRESEDGEDGADGADMAQPGALLASGEGDPIWFLPAPDEAAIRAPAVQRLEGQPVLTYWRGESDGTEGEYVVLGTNYGETRIVQAGDELVANPLGMRITPAGTAWLVATPVVETVIDGEERAVRTAVLQEISLEDNEVLFRWDALDHIPSADSEVAAPEDPTEPWDYLGIAGLALAEDGDVLITGHGTGAIYRVDRESGELDWRLGGKASDFVVEADAEFRWPRDARLLPDGRLSVFDGATRTPHRGLTEEKIDEAEENGEDPIAPPASRALVLDLNEVERTASIAAAYSHPFGWASPGAGSHQVLPSGNSLVTWGEQGALTEFAPGGEIVRHLVFPASMRSSGAELVEWSGLPFVPPVVDARADDLSTRVSVSWNGATPVNRWRIWAGPSEDELEVVRTVPRDGFETEAIIDGAFAAVRVDALDVIGETIGSSAVTPVD